MLKKLLLLGSAAVLITQVCGAATLTLNGKTYAVTTGTYDGDSNWNNEVQAEFGSGSSVADFATLKQDSAGSANALWDFLNAGGASTAYIKYNGAQFYGGMPLFLQEHENFPGYGWFVIDNIDPTPVGYPKRIDLGRWDLGNQKILAVTTTSANDSTSAVPEASTSLGLLVLGSAGVLTRRRITRAA